jgi:hypothetical protein
MWYNQAQQPNETAHALPTLTPLLITERMRLPMTDIYPTTTPPLKRCTKCGREFPATPEFFHKNARGKNGLRGYCNTCERESDRHWYAEHIEQRHENSRRYRARHPEQWHELNRCYKAEHSEQINAINQRRRARVRGLPNTFTGDQAIAALTYWRWKCAYCGVSLAQLSMFENIRTHMDHYIAITDPRPNNPGTVAENMLPTCADCNLNKHNYDPIDWITRTFGARKAKKIIAAIEAYFASLAVQS